MLAHTHKKKDSPQHCRQKKKKAIEPHLASAALFTTRRFVGNDTVYGKKKQRVFIFALLFFSIVVVRTSLYDTERKKKKMVFYRTQDCWGKKRKQEKQHRHINGKRQDFNRKTSLQSNTKDKIQRKCN